MTSKQVAVFGLKIKEVRYGPALVMSSTQTHIAK